MKKVRPKSITRYTALMFDNSSKALKRAVQDRLRCKAWFKQTVHIQDVMNSNAICDRDVHIFDLDYHGDIDRAWPHRMPDGEQRTFVVEHTGPTAGPRDAVRAAIIAEAKAK